jgi:hypothetical protein
MSLIFSLSFLIAAILGSTDASDFNGRIKVNSYLTAFIVFLLIYVVLSSLNVLLNIIKWAKLSDKMYNRFKHVRVSHESLNMTRSGMERTNNSETMLNEIITGSPGSIQNNENSPHEF